MRRTAGLAHNDYMLIAFIFLMGIANFALHRAVLAARGTVPDQMQDIWPRRAGRFTFPVEFAVLLAALFFAFEAESWVLLAYGIYTAANAVAAWFILTRRM